MLSKDLWNIVNDYLCRRIGQRVKFRCSNLEWFASFQTVSGTIKHGKNNTIEFIEESRTTSESGDDSESTSESESESEDD